MNPTQNDNYFVWAVEQSFQSVVAVVVVVFAAATRFNDNTMGQYANV